MSEMRFLYLSQEDVIAAGGLDMEQHIATVEESFRLHGQGKTILPGKQIILWGDVKSEFEQGRIISMPAYVGGDIDKAGLKWIAGMPHNPRRHGLPRAIALLLLTEPRTGVPLAVMDGTLISAMRTGAASGVAARYLARRSSQVVGIIGAGVQARTQLRALKIALPALTRVQIFDIQRERAQALRREVEEQLQLTATVTSSAQEAFEGADVCVAATVAKDPYVHGDWLQPGALYIEISSWDGHLDVLQRVDKIIVDDWKLVSHRKHLTARGVAEGVISEGDIYAEFGQIVNGNKPGRERDDECILFNPIGLPAHDVAVAAYIYERARQQGIGQDLKLWENPIWV